MRKSLVFLLVLFLSLSGCEKKDRQTSSGSTTAAPNPAPVALVTGGPPVTANQHPTPKSVVPEHQELTPEAADRVLDALIQQVDVPNIPNDPKLRAQLRNKYLNWYRARTIGVFNRSANAKAPWADKARAAFESRSQELSLHMLTGQVDTAARLEGNRLIHEALDAGADDPVLSYWSRLLDVWSDRIKWNDNIAEAISFADAVEKSSYPNLQKLHTTFNLLNVLYYLPPNHPSRAGLARREARYWGLFARVAASEDPLEQAALASVAEAWISLATRKGIFPSSAAAREEIADRYRKAGISEYEQLIADASVAIERGSAARGAGVASTVTPEGWKTLGAEFEKASQALKKAWELKPDRWEAPSQMVLIGRGAQFSREEMNRWFERAMRANPDNRMACIYMMSYLHPKWFGTMQEYQAFQWKCIRHPVASSQIPFVPVLSNYYDTTPRSQANWPYYRQPLVWHLIQRSYEAMLAASPNDPMLRSGYAFLACCAGRYKIANEQFDRMGNKYWLDIFGNDFEYQRLRAEAKANSR